MELPSFLPSSQGVEFYGPAARLLETKLWYPLGGNCLERRGEKNTSLLLREIEPRPSSS